MASDPKTWRVLIVDDEQDNRHVLAEILTLRGAAAVPVESGADALAALENFQPNLVLLDLSMPGMDGWDLYPRLREHPASAAAPIIAVTAMAMSSDIDRATQMGFDAYIIKPFRAAQMISVVQACMDRKVSDT